MSFPFYRSIRLRLTCWYALTLAVILAASALFTYFHFSKNLHKQIDDRLLEVSQELVRSKDLLFNSEGQIYTCKPLQDLIHKYNWDEFIQLRTTKLEVSCASENLQTMELSIGPVARQQVRWKHSHIETVYTADRPAMRLLSFPLVADGRLSGIVQVGAELGPMEETINELKLVYLLAGPFAVFWLCLGCWVLADRALAPIIEVTQEARRINADNLSRRLPPLGSRDELAEMVDTFNEMLSRLDDSFQRIKQFSGDASHELRTPLTILRGETEVTLRWAKSLDEVKNMMSSNLEEIDRMERIIENLLTLARSESGDISLEMKDLSFSDLVQELYLQGKTLGDPKEIEVTMNLDVEEEIRIFGDELRLRQLFLNLISNGIKYTPDGGRLDIRLSIEDQMACVTISDTGLGIAEHHLARIFDRFYRADQARNRKEGGTGLGLSIVKWIVDAHGGTITVRSKLNEGSTFLVRLPMGGPQAVPAESSPEETLEG